MDTHFHNICICLATDLQLLVLAPRHIYRCSHFLFSSSAAFHTMLCVSKEVYDWFRKVDFIGIVTIMFCMFLPFCWYTFSTIVFAVYITLASITSIACVTVALSPKFSSNEFHVYRPLVFASLGLLGAICIVHGYLVHKDTWVASLCGAQLGCCTIGALFYMAKWPERKYTWASYFGSHQIFHIFVAVGIWFFYMANAQLLSNNNLGQM